MQGSIIGAINGHTGSLDYSSYINPVSILDSISRPWDSPLLRFRV